MRRNRTPRTYIWPEQLGGGCLFIELGAGSLFWQSAPDQGNKRMGLGKKGKSILLEEAERVNAMELTEERQRKIRPGNLFRRPPGELGCWLECSASQGAWLPSLQQGSALSLPCWSRVSVEAAVLPLLLPRRPAPASSGLSSCLALTLSFVCGCPGSFLPFVSHSEHIGGFCRVCSPPSDIGY